MRKTFRSSNNKEYWTDRWINIETDDEMIDTKSYPLRCTLKAISYQKNQQSILEAGCGAGRILKYLHNKNYNVTGIDFIKEAIVKIQNENKNIKADTANILKTNFKESNFDTILAFGLYHNFEIENVKKAFSETFRILKKGGILCFSFRADNLQNLILDKFKSKKKEQNENFHKLNLTEKEIINILKSFDLEVLDKEYIVNMPLLYQFKIFRSKNQKKFNEHIGRRDGYKLNFFGNFIHKFLYFFFPRNYCNVFVFYVKK